MLGGNKLYYSVQKFATKLLSIEMQEENCMRLIMSRNKNGNED